MISEKGKAASISISIRNRMSISIGILAKALAFFPVQKERKKVQT